LIVSLIVALDEKGGIGKDNRLPWHLSSDLKRFKQLTMGHHLIMGRLTYETIGKPLPGRTTIVITRNPLFQPAGCQVATSLEEALSLAKENGETEAFIAGGGEIFTQALPLADRIYLTQIHAVVEANIFFPHFSFSEWKEIESIKQQVDEKNDYPYTFKILEKNLNPPPG
jgi:dihydrofolate reductase